MFVLFGSLTCVSIWNPFKGRARDGRWFYNFFSKKNIKIQNHDWMTFRCPGSSWSTHRVYKVLKNDVHQLKYGFCTQRCSKTFPYDRWMSATISNPWNSDYLLEKKRCTPIKTKVFVTTDVRKRSPTPDGCLHPSQIHESTGAQETICCDLLENRKISRFVAYYLGLAL